MKRSRQQSHAQTNLEAARIIAADTQKYGGPQSLLVRWAGLWLANHQTEVSESGRAAA